MSFPPTKKELTSQVSSFLFMMVQAAVGPSFMRRRKRTAAVFTGMGFIPRDGQSAATPGASAENCMKHPVKHKGTHQGNRPHFIERPIGKHRKQNNDTADHGHKKPQTRSDPIWIIHAGFPPPSTSGIFWISSIIPYLPEKCTCFFEKS